MAILKGPYKETQLKCSNLGSKTKIASPNLLNAGFKDIILHRIKEHSLWYI